MDKPMGDSTRDIRVLQPGQIAVSREKIEELAHAAFNGEAGFVADELRALLTSPAAEQPIDGVDICGHDSRYPDMDNQPKPSCPEIPDNSNAPCCYDCATAVQRTTMMILCPECGNKRCPRATNHKHLCTGSNEPGQMGSRYGKLQPGSNPAREGGTDV